MFLMKLYLFWISYCITVNFNSVSAFLHSQYWREVNARSANHNDTKQQTFEKHIWISKINLANETSNKFKLYSENFNKSKEVFTDIKSSVNEEQLIVVLSPPITKGLFKSFLEENVDFQDISSCNLNYTIRWSLAYIHPIKNEALDSYLEENKEYILNISLFGNDGYHVIINPRENLRNLLLSNKINFEEDCSSTQWSILAINSSNIENLLQRFKSTFLEYLNKDKGYIAPLNFGIGHTLDPNLQYNIFLVPSTFQTYFNKFLTFKKINYNCLTSSETSLETRWNILEIGPLKHSNLLKKFENTFQNLPIIGHSENEESYILLLYPGVLEEVKTFLLGENITFGILNSPTRDTQLHLYAIETKETIERKKFLDFLANETNDVFPLTIGALFKPSSPLKTTFKDWEVLALENRGNKDATSEVVDYISDSNIETLSQVAKITRNADMIVLVPANEVDKFKEFLAAHYVGYKLVNKDFHKYLQEEQKVRTAALNETFSNSYYPMTKIIDMFSGLRTNYSDTVFFDYGTSSVYDRADVKSLNEEETFTNIIVVAGIHARDFLSVSMALYLLNELVTNRIENIAMVEDINWHIIPLLNPKGYIHAFTNVKLLNPFTYYLKKHSNINRIWKFNINSKYPCNGVDLNRNFDTPKRRILTKYSTLFGGHKPFSEPETKSLKNYFANLGAIKTLITLHSGECFIAFPYGYTEKPSPKLTELKIIALHIKNVMENFDKSCIYKVGSAYEILGFSPGLLIDYFHDYHQPYSFMISLGKHEMALDPFPKYIEETIIGGFEVFKVFAKKIKDFLLDDNLIAYRDYIRSMP